MKKAPLLLTLAMVTILCIPPTAWGKEKVHKILLLPFRVFASQEYAYLKQGLTATLNNRLQQPGIQVLLPTEEMLSAAAKPDAPLSQEAILTIGASLGADLAVAGTVTIVGTAASTSIRLIAVPEGANRLNFHADGERPDDVLSHMDQFVRQMEAALLGKAPAPESSLAFSDEKGKPGPPGITWQSERLDYAIRGMVVEDLSPTPGNEIALIDNHRLNIYRKEGDRLVSLVGVDTFKYPPFLRLIAIDAADIDGNGQTDLFVTAFHERIGKPRSFIIEWDITENRFRERYKDLPFYFRVLNDIGNAPELVAQSAGTTGFFGKGPTLMQYESGYEGHQPLTLPNRVNIYDFVLGRFLPQTENTIVALDRQKRLMVYTSPDQKRWTSEEKYGGSAVFLDDSQTPENQDKQLKQVGEQKIQRFYLHPRMRLVDLDRDGIQELIVVHNKDAARGLFRRARLLTSGRIVCLNWQPLGPITRWETPKVSGYIADLTLNDLDEDGRTELIYAVVDRQSKGIDNHHSFLVAHTIP